MKEDFNYEENHSVNRILITHVPVKQDYDPQHTMLALNMAIVSVHRILTTKSKAVLDEEYSNIVKPHSIKVECF